MRLGGIAVSVALVPLLASTASARPVTVGAGLGILSAENDWDDVADDTMQVFGRIGLTARVAVQLELQKIESSQTDATMRMATALLVVELGQSGRLVPTMFAGFGAGSTDDAYVGTIDMRHIEGGFGLEYRGDGGLVIMADVRLGGRENDDSDIALLDVGTSYALPFSNSEYRSARLGAAIRF